MLPMHIIQMLTGGEPYFFQHKVFQTLPETLPPKKPQTLPQPYGPSPPVDLIFHLVLNV